MSLPKDGGDVGGPAALAPGGGGSARPREGSRDIQKEGKIVSVPDDWCHSPIKIVPYPIWAWQSDASNLADTVRQTDDRSHAKHSIVQMSFGDEAGVGGGVISHTHNGACWPKTWSETVRFEGRNAVRHNDEWWMNNNNTWGKLQYQKDINNYDLPVLTLIKSDIPVLGDEDGPKTRVAGAIALPLAGGGAAAEGTGLGGAVLGAAPAVAAVGGAVVGAGAVGIGAAGLVAAGHEAHMTILAGPNVSAPGAPTIEQIERAYSKMRVAALAAAKVKPIPWVRVSAGLCAALACPATPLPGSLYKGGTYLCTKGGGNEGHHTPAASVSYLPYSAGPSVQMTPTDHAATASYGSSASSFAYRGAQATAIGSGNFMGAVAMDVADLSRSKFHHKYDGAVAQMLAYANCLKQNGFVR